MKRPAFQFYPADWRKDLGVRACSIAARGMWIEIMCMAHEGEVYGHLIVSGKPMTDAQIAVAAGTSVPAGARLIAELGDAGVFSRDSTGAIFCRRMVRDERIRNARADDGKLGGNPALVNRKDDGKVVTKVNHTPNLKPTPSSSVSSSLNHGVGNGTTQWWKTDKGIEEMARSLGVESRTGEQYSDLKRRCFDAISAAKRGR